MQSCLVPLSAIYLPPLTTESPTTHTTDQHHVPMDPRAAQLMPIHAARLALTRSVTHVTQKFTSPLTTESPTTHYCTIYLPKLRQKRRARFSHTFFARSCHLTPSRKSGKQTFKLPPHFDSRRQPRPHCHCLDALSIQISVSASRVLSVHHAFSLLLPMLLSLAGSLHRRCAGAGARRAGVRGRASINVGVFAQIGPGQRRSLPGR